MVYMMLADGFEEAEAICPLDVLIRAGADVKTVSVGDRLTVTGTHGIEIKADMLLRDIPDERPEMIVLPGGMPGASNLNSCDPLKNMLLDLNAHGGFIGAICAAPFILGEMDLLVGKEAICYPGFEKSLRGAKISGKQVVRDQNIITAAGMGVAIEFGYELAYALKGKEAADLVMTRILKS